MLIHLISENVIDSMLNQVESGFSSNLTSNASQTAKSGIYLMELSLGVNCFRETVRNDWRSDIRAASLQSHLTEEEKRTEIIIAVATFLGLAIAWSVLLDIFSSAIRFIALSLVGLMGIGAFVGFVILPIFRFIKSIKYKANISADLQKAESNVDEQTLYNRCVNSECDINYCLNQLCYKMGVDPTELKLEFGRAESGSVSGSTFIGWGSAGAIGAGLAMTAFSKMNAASKNAELNRQADEVNRRIETVESYFFFNSVALHYNCEFSEELN